MNNRPLHTALFAAALALAGTGAAQAQDALTAPQVRAQLEAQGYTKVKDLEFEDGMWKAGPAPCCHSRIGNSHPRFAGCPPVSGQLQDRLSCAAVVVPGGSP